MFLPRPGRDPLLDVLDLLARSVARRREPVELARHQRGGDAEAQLAGAAAQHERPADADTGRDAETAQAHGVPSSNPRATSAHSALLRYVYDNLDGERSLLNPASDSSQIDVFNRAHSLVGEENWAVSSRVANMFCPSCHAS